MLNDLIQIAQDNRSSQRNELMDRVSTLFAEGADQFSDQEIHLFGDVITRLLDDTDTQTRSNLSNLVAPIPQTPQGLIVKLAHDDILVAGPVLKHSDILATSDLVEIASSKTTAHRVAITVRAELDEEITDALIKSDEREVLHGVTANKSAKISDWGFDQLADRAIANRPLRDSLCERKDITLDATEKVMPLLSAMARQKLASLVQGVAFNMDERVFTAKEKAKSEKGENQTNLILSRNLISQVKSGERKLDQVCKYLASQDRPMDLSQVLSIFSGQTEQQVSHAFTKVNGDKIASLCQTLGLSAKTFAEIAGMWCKRLNLPGSHKHWIIQKYAELDSENTLISLRSARLHRRSQFA